MNFEPDTLKKLLRLLADTRSSKIGGHECFEKLDRFAEYVLAGKSAEEAMRVVKDHLDRSHKYRKEFEALLEVPRAMAER
jgi:hypothetical protein